MSKNRILIFTTMGAFSIAIVFQLRIAARLSHELTAVREENSRLRQDLSAPDQNSSSSSLRVNADENAAEARQHQLEELQSEVARLRAMASRTVRAEAELAQLKSALQSHQSSTASPVPDANSNSNALVAFLGEAVPPPANLDPAYSKEGLLNAIQQAAQLAGVSLKKVEIETSEVPFLAGVVCDIDADFEKLKAQFKNMPGYEYGGATSNHGTYAFNITPYRSFPSEAGQRIRRRTTLRMQMFFDQLAAR